MTELLVSPTIAGFSVGFGNNVLSTELDGGASRTRLDKIGAAHKVQVQWMLEARGYNYLEAFYRTEICLGALPFTVKLKAVDTSNLGTYTAKIVPGTFGLIGFFENIYQVGATLELTPLAVNESADQALIAAGPGE
jgi:hypothetical protein